MLYNIVVTELEDNEAVNQSNIEVFLLWWLQRKITELQDEQSLYLPPLQTESKRERFLWQSGFNSYESRTNYHPQNIALRLADMNSEKAYYERRFKSSVVGNIKTGHFLAPFSIRVQYSLVFLFAPRETCIKSKTALTLALKTGLNRSSIDPLHKWRPNLNNNTWYILSLTFMRKILCLET